MTPSTATFRVWRGDESGGKLVDYTTPVSEGMVVLDAIHQIQADHANDLAVRWNCKAGKCGSCSAEINGKPKLMCMTRLNDLPLDKPVTAAKSPGTHCVKPSDRFMPKANAISSTPAAPSSSHAM